MATMFNINAVAEPSSGRIEPIRDWALGILDVVKALSPRTAQLYGNEQRREHCIQTAEFFDRVIPEHRALSQAAFLHAVRDTHSLFRLSDSVDPLVLEILDDRKRLRTVSREDEYSVQQFVSTVLPTLRHAEAAILLVVEQLLHLDPLGQLADFSQNFARYPRSCPESIQICPSEFVSLSAHLAYIERVVIPTARFFGLWFHKNFCEDLCLYYGNRNRFHELLDFVLQKTQSRGSHNMSEAERRVRVIRDALRTFHQDEIDVFWEWHHIGSLDRRLAPTITDENTMEPLSLCGMVTIVCSKLECCYKVLGCLHASPLFQHQTLDIKDTLGDPFKSSYEALHTMIAPLDETGPDSNSIRIRITYAEAQIRRYELFTKSRLKAMQDQLDKRGRDKEMQVFSKDGRAVLLPAGSTILNFAYEVHDDFVALAQTAYVNGREVDLLHSLVEGDVVWLEIGSEPQPLPLLWEKKVPETTIAKIKDKHRKHYKPGLIAKGRRLFRNRIQDNGIRQIVNERIYDEATVDGFLEEVLLATSANRRIPSTDVSYWFRQIALAEQHPSHKQEISGFLDELAREVADRFKRSRRVSIEFIHVPQHLQGRFKLIVLCRRCNPGVGDDVVGRLDDQQLTIHLRSCSKSAADCIQIEWQEHFTRGQYFTIEISNRLGIGSEILRIFARRNVDIVEVVGAALGQNWAVMRVHIQTVGPKLVADLVQGLAQVRGVLRVVHPDEEISPVLEGALPPREHPKITRSAQQSPYFCGPCLPHDQYFYGRQKELERLRELFEMVKSPESQLGLVTFVKGALKTGKSSLVQKFARQLGRIGFECTTVNLTANDGETWSSLATRLANTLSSERKRLTSGHGPGLAEPAPLSLANLLKSFRYDLNRSLVLIIDEATPMFFDTVHANEASLIVDFMRLVRSVAGVLLIWVGPEVTLSALPANLIAEISAADAIDVRGLEYSDVKRLLQAENFRYRGLRIDVDNAVVKEIFQYTRGNAYWCNILANELFNLQPAVNGRITYRQDQLDGAKRRLTEQKIAFRARTEDFCARTEFGGVIPIVLKILSELERDMSTDELNQKLSESGFRITREAISKILEQLQARGAIRLGGKICSWQIDSPALAHHLIHWSAE